MTHLIEYLQLAGLSEREARVYLACLTMESGTAQEIAVMAQISRTLAYPILETLMSLDLVKQRVGERRRVFCAVPPEQVAKILYSQVAELTQRARRLEEAMPELKAVVRGNKARPYAAYYEGKEGVQQIAARYEETTADFVEIVPYEAVFSFFEHGEFSDHQERLVHNRMHGRILIVAKEPPLKWMKNYHDRFGWDLRYLEEERAPLTGHVSVKGNEIYAVCYGDQPMGVCIENAPIAQALRRVFDLAWNSASFDVRFPMREYEATRR